MARRPGFTLIELLVVLAILALLLTIASPRYIHHIDRAREASLRGSLKVMRDAIDKFEGDQGRLPESLDELVARSYITSIPKDPITDRADSWVTNSAAETPAMHGAGPSSHSGIADVHSGADGNGEDGTAYRTW